MQWQTHAAIGANAAWLVPLLGQFDERTPLFLALGAFGGLLPDIDAGGGAMKYGAKIHYIGGGVLGGFQGIARHRAFFHSFVCVCLVFCLFLPFGIWVDPFIPCVITLGYLSHLLIDHWNGGMQFFFPMKRFVSFVPRSWQFRVRSEGDMFCMIIGVFGILLFVMMHYPDLLASFDVQKLMPI